jgi:hypothetical protein
VDAVEFAVEVNIYLTIIDEIVDIPLSISDNTIEDMAEMVDKDILY